MVSPARKVTRRPDLLLYKPGQGLKNKGFKSYAATRTEKTIGAESKSCHHNESPGSVIFSDCMSDKLKNITDTPKTKTASTTERRHAIPIYQPKAELSVLKRNEKLTDINCSSLKPEGKKCDILTTDLKNTVKKQTEFLQSVSPINCDSTKVCSEIPKPSKKRRPDIQIYVPKARLYASQIKETACSSVQDCPKINDESSLKFDAAPHFSCNSSNVDVLVQPEVIKTSVENKEEQCSKVSHFPSNSWADQVEEYQPATCCSNVEDDNNSLNRNIIEQNNKLGRNEDNCSSEHGNETVNLVRDKTSIQDDKTGASDNDKNQPLRHPFTGAFVQSGSDMFNKLKAREDIIDQQIAIFDRMLARGSPDKMNIFKKMVIPKNLAQSDTLSAVSVTSIPCTSVPTGSKHEDKSSIQASYKQTLGRLPEVKSKASASATMKVENNDYLAGKKQPLHQQVEKLSDMKIEDELALLKSLSQTSSVYPVKNDLQYLKMLAKRDSIVDQQIAMFDNMVITIKSGRRKSKSNISAVKPRLPVPCYLEINSNNSQDLQGNREKTFDNQVSTLSNVSNTTSKSSVQKVEAPVLPLCSPCIKIDHRFCSYDCLDSYYCSTPLDPCPYIPPPQPLVKI